MPQAPRTVFTLEQSKNPDFSLSNKESLLCFPPPGSSLDHLISRNYYPGSPAIRQSISSQILQDNPHLNPKLFSGNDVVSLRMPFQQKKPSSSELAEIRQTQSVWKAMSESERYFIQRFPTESYSLIDYTNMANTFSTNVSKKLGDFLLDAGKDIEKIAENFVAQKAGKLSPYQYRKLRSEGIKVVEKKLGALQKILFLSADTSKNFRMGKNIGTAGRLLKMQKVAKKFIKFGHIGQAIDIGVKVDSLIKAKAGSKMELAKEIVADLAGEFSGGLAAGYIAATVFGVATGGIGFAIIIGLGAVAGSEFSKALYRNRNRKKEWFFDILHNVERSLEGVVVAAKSLAQPMPANTVNNIVIY